MAPIYQNSPHLKGFQPSMHISSSKPSPSVAMAMVAITPVFLLALLLLSPPLALGGRLSPFSYIKFDAFGDLMSNCGVAGDFLVIISIISVC